MPSYGPVDPPTNVKGRPSRMQKAAVVTLNPDGTVDAKLRTSRAVRVSVPVFLNGAAVALGDEVILVDLDGDPNTPAIIASRTPVVL